MENQMKLDNRLWSNTAQRVAEFKRLFGQNVASDPTVGDEDRRKLAATLILEEALEFVEACGLQVAVVNSPSKRHNIDMIIVGDPNLIEMADALADEDYVTKWANLEFGIPDEPVAIEVQRSNMTKAWPHCSKCDADMTLGPCPCDPQGNVDIVRKAHKREDGKIIKSPDYSPADIPAVLSKIRTFNHLPTADIMNYDFNVRPRYSKTEAQDRLAKHSPMVRHLLDNQDGTWSILAHVNVEWCDYCTEVENGNTNHIAKSDPYENTIKSI